MAFSLGDLLARVGLDLSGFQSDLSEFNNQLRGAVRTAERDLDGILKIGDKLKNVGLGLTAAFTVPLVGFGTLATQKAIEMEGLTRALDTVATASDTTAMQLERLKEAAKLPGLGFREAIQGSILLQATGTAAKDAERYLMAFGNALANVGRGRADLDAITVQLSQMLSKTNVLAQDLKPILERVPQVGKILRERFGTVDSEEISKKLKQLGLGVKDFVGLVVSELEKLPKATDTLGNKIENFRDKFDRTLAALGRTLTPVVGRVLDALDPMLDWAERAAATFSQLPAPLQAFGVALAGVAAAAGPLLVAIGGIGLAMSGISTALGPIAAALGVSVAGMLGWAAAIGAAVAALTALGVWIYQNWEPIKTTVLYAWSGLREIWGAAWDGISAYVMDHVNALVDAFQNAFGPLIQFLSNIWSNIAPAFSAAWGVIRQMLLNDLDVLRRGFEFIWNQLTTIFNGLVDLARKIPGVDKLLNLGNVWREAKAYNDAMRDAAASTANLAKAGNDASAAATKLHGTLDAGAAKHERYAGAVKRTAKELLEASNHALSLERLQQAVTIAVGAQQSLEQIYAQSRLDQDLDRITAAIDRQRSSAESVGTAIEQGARAISVLGNAAKDSLRDIESLDRAFAALNVTTSYDLNSQADRARQAFEVVRQAYEQGIATQYELNQATKTYLELQIKAREAAGENATQLRAELDQVNRALGEHSKNLGGYSDAWKTMQRQVSTIITDFSKNITDLIFKGGSLIDVFKEMGKSFMRFFIEQAMAGVQKFISTALTDLMGGKGFGGVEQAVVKLGRKIVDVFAGTGSSAASTATTAATRTASGAGGAAASTALTSVTGVVTAVGAVASAISGIIGNFQMGEMNKTLDLIERSTRETSIVLWQQPDAILFTSKETSQNTAAALDRLRDIRDGLFDPVTVTLERIEQILANLHLSVGEVARNTNPVETPRFTPPDQQDTYMPQGPVADFSQVLRNTGDTLSDSTSNFSTSVQTFSDAVDTATQPTEQQPKGGKPEKGYVPPPASDLLPEGSPARSTFDPFAWVERYMPPVEIAETWRGITEAFAKVADTVSQASTAVGEALAYASDVVLTTALPAPSEPVLYAPGGTGLKTDTVGYTFSGNPLSGNQVNLILNNPIISSQRAADELMNTATDRLRRTLKL